MQWLQQAASPVRVSRAVCPAPPLCPALSLPEDDLETWAWSELGAQAKSSAELERRIAGFQAALAYEANKVMRQCVELPCACSDCFAVVDVHHLLA